MKPNFDPRSRRRKRCPRDGAADKARIGSFATHIQIDPPSSSDRMRSKILRTELQRGGPTPLWNAVDTAIDKLILSRRRVVPCPSR
jgi:hypothetical protein